MNKMSEDRCIFILKNWFLDNVYKENNNDLNNIDDLEHINFVKAIETILAELEKKDKIIELMIKHLCDVINNDSDASLLPFCDSDDNLEEKVKKYFERRSENE